VALWFGNLCMDHKILYGTRVNKQTNKQTNKVQTNKHQPCIKQIKKYHGNSYILAKKIIALKKDKKCIILCDTNSRMAKGQLTALTWISFIYD
jgi:hypothetical protein